MDLRYDRTASVGPDNQHLGRSVDNIWAQGEIAKRRDQGRAYEQAALWLAKASELGAGMREARAQPVAEINAEPEQVASSPVARPEHR